MRTPQKTWFSHFPIRRFPEGSHQGAGRNRKPLVAALVNPIITAWLYLCTALTDCYRQEPSLLWLLPLNRVQNVVTPITTTSAVPVMTTLGNWWALYLPTASHYHGYLMSPTPTPRFLQTWKRSKSGDYCRPAGVLSSIGWRMSQEWRLAQTR